MDNEYLIKVKVEMTGYATVVAPNEDEAWTKIVKQEGYDPSDIQETTVIDIEPLKVIDVQKCEMAKDD
jgi:hypothetical protein